MRVFLTAISLLLASTLTAQQQMFTLDAQLRTRGEYNNGAIQPRNEGQKAAFYINERARVMLGYQRQWLELKVGVQHTGVWGQDGMNERNGRLAMNEAWGKVRFGTDFFAQVGRQQLSYDDERLLGSSDWNVAGSWHDALRLGYSHQGTTVHLIAAFNQNEENQRSSYYKSGMPYKQMQAVWAHHEFGELPLGVSLLAMNVAREAGSTDTSSTRHLQTVGTYLTYKPKWFELEGSFYFQTGKATNGKKVSAFMASLRSTVHLGQDWNLHAAYDYLSGNDGHNTNQHAFDPLYGTHHKFYGNMDYFTGPVVYGLQDIQGGVQTSVLKPVDIGIDYHCFLLAERINGLNSLMGHEIDCQVKCNIMKDVVLAAGYSVCIGTETMDYIKGGNHKSWQDWAWLSLNISPRILSTKWK